MPNRPADFVVIAESIHNNEKIVVGKIESCEYRINSLNNRIEMCQDNIEFLEAQMAAVRSKTDENGNPDYAEISSIGARISMEIEDIRRAEKDIAIAEVELSEARSDLTKIRVEKEKTLNEIKEKADKTSRGMSFAGTMSGDYLGHGNDLYGAMNNSLQTYAIAANLLGGSVATAPARSIKLSASNGKVAVSKTSKASFSATVNVFSSNTPESDIGDNQYFSFRDFSGVASAGRNFSTFHGEKTPKRSNFSSVKNSSTSFSSAFGKDDITKDGISFESEQKSKIASEKSGLFSQFKNISNSFHNVEKNQFPAKIKHYVCHEDLDEETDLFARDYQCNHEKYNDVIRSHRSSKEIDKFRRIINSNYIHENSTFYRKATLRDLGEKFANLPLNELVGKSYQFEGIMSASGTLNLPNNVSSGDVIFEIKAPVGMPALDLTQVGYFQEVMFDSPMCYIESVEKCGYNTTRIVIHVSYSKEYNSIVDSLENARVDLYPIKLHDRAQTTDEIIKRLGGGDKTNGSCSSLAFAYAGNIGGYDVLDFRGGESRKFFASNDNIEMISHLSEVKALTVYGLNDITCANDLLSAMVSEKEYYFATGLHASVVRKHEGHFEYLELQSAVHNGWHLLTNEVLYSRFRCSESNQSKLPNFLIDIDSLYKSKEFLNILGYINTVESKQIKGRSGYVR